MTSKTVTIAPDGSMTITKDADSSNASPTASVPAMVVHRGHGDGPFHAGSFIAGLVVGMLVLLFLQRLRRNRLHRSSKFERGRDDAGRMESEVAALARRTATLETIVTDPGERTAREIDALR